VADLRRPRTGVDDVVNVEARIGKFCSFSQRLPDIAVIFWQLVIRRSELSGGLLWRREDQVLVNVACEATIIRTCVEVIQVAFIQTEYVVPIRRIGGKWHQHLDVAVADDCGVDVHPHEIVVLRLSGAYELVGDTLARVTKMVQHEIKQTAPAMYGMYTPA